MERQDTTLQDSVRPDFLCSILIRNAEPEKKDPKRELKNLARRIGRKIFGPIETEGPSKLRKNEDVYNKVGKLRMPSGEEN